MSASASSTRRTASREKRRQQLINATMKCIARKGMGSTTLGDVASEAGLSAGIVNLHFESKDNLLMETLRHLSDEYRTQFDRALSTSGPSAASKLTALMQLDLRPSICDVRKIAVWFAFWGEVKSRPTYRKICAESDRYYDTVVVQLCNDIIHEGGYDGVSASAVATILTSTTNGLWLSCLIESTKFDQQAALASVLQYLATVFPKHFPT